MIDQIGLVVFDLLYLMYYYHQDSKIVKSVE